MGISFTELTEQHLKGSLITSLLSVWVLVALFFYLNLYTKRRYFTVWMTAWLFYALWLTIGLTAPVQSTTGLLFVLKQSCIALSATLLLWGSSLFLEKPLPERAVALFSIFLIIWVYASSQSSPTQLETRLAMFLLLGLSSVFTGVAFYKLRKKDAFYRGRTSQLWFHLLGDLPFKLSPMARIFRHVPARIPLGNSPSTVHRRKHDNPGPGRSTI